MDKIDNYPPGIDRRLVDWVRLPESLAECSNASCNAPSSRETEFGILCLACYQSLTACNEPGCHKPALDVLDPVNNSSNRKGWILKCRDHYYDAQEEADIIAEQQENMRRGSSHTNGCTF